MRHSASAFGTLVCTLMFSIGCQPGPSTPLPDGGPMPVVDAGSEDGGPIAEADGGVVPDAGPLPDAGATDGGSPDGGNTGATSLALSDGPAFSFGAVAVNAHLEHLFFLTNTGTIAATGLGLTGPAAPFSLKGSSGLCAGSLAPGVTCAFVISFAPTVTGTYGPSVFTVTDDQSGGASAAQGAVSGSATQLAIVQLLECPSCAPGTAPIDYGTAGTPVDRTFTLSNVGATSATSLADLGTLGNQFAYAGGSYPGTGGTCGTSLAAGAQCKVVVTFIPSGDGARSSTLSLGYFDGSSAVSVSRALSGVAVSAAKVSLADCASCLASTGPTDFGVSGFPVDKGFYVNNLGGQSATSLAATLATPTDFTFKGGSYPGQGGTCGSTLAAGAQCVVVVTFDPTGSGVRSDTFTVGYFDGANAQTVSRALTGTATQRAQLSISEFSGPPGCGNACGPFEFPNTDVGSSQHRTFVVTNSGAAAVTQLGDSATLTPPFGYEGGSYPGSNATCASTLAVGATCQLVLRFAPTQPVVSTGKVTLHYEDGLGPTLQAERLLKGTGVPPP